jgi:uncharacterized alpha-E superfamily protein
MLSRVAENLYWVSRYIERVENLSRLLNVAFYLELDATVLGGALDDPAPIESVMLILACRDAYLRSGGSDPRDHNAVLRFLTFDRHHDHSILAMLARARENARSTQETLSGEVWSQINKLYLYVGSARARRRFAASPTRFLDSIKQACVLSAGLIDGTLPRTEAYHFLQLGRHLERVNQISRILAVKLRGLDPETEAKATGDTIRVIHWSSLLRSCSAYEAYIRAHHERIDPEGVVRYLVLEPTFPRSLRFCVARCLVSLREIGESDGTGYGSEAERQLGRLDSELHYLEVGEIFARGLLPFLAGIQDACNAIGDEIHQAYFFT